MAKSETVYGCRVWSDDGKGNVTDATYSSRDTAGEAESVGYAIYAALRSREVETRYETLEVLAAAMAYVTIDHGEELAMDEDRALVEVHKAVEKWWRIRCDRHNAMDETLRKIKANRKEAPDGK